MKHLKTLTLSMLFIPAMATAQMTSTHGANGLPMPGAQDHPGLTALSVGGGAPQRAYFEMDQPIPGASDHPGISGQVIGGGRPAQVYYEKDQPIPGASDHPNISGSRN